MCVEEDLKSIYVHGLKICVALPNKVGQVRLCTCNMPFDELVRAEAIFNCKVKKLCGFVCLLVLSTVTCTHGNVFILS